MAGVEPISGSVSTDLAHVELVKCEEKASTYSKHLAVHDGLKVPLSRREVLIGGPLWNLPTCPLQIVTPSRAEPT